MGGRKECSLGSIFGDNCYIRTCLFGSVINPNILNYYIGYPKKMGHEGVKKKKVLYLWTFD